MSADILSPLVTVLMPVFNAEKYLAESVESILHQTFRDFELLIINDGSTDHSLEIIRALKDPRIRVITHESNLKLIATLNNGIGLAAGKYIARMDADDISLPHRLQRQVEFMEAHPDTGLCGSWFETFGSEKKVVKYPEKDADIRIMMLYQSPFCHPSVMFRKEVFDKNQIRFLPEFIHAEDYEAWLRLAGVTRFANIPEVLLKYRAHEKSVSASYQHIQRQNTVRIIRMAFEKSGVKITEEEALLFREVAYSNFTAGRDFVRKAEDILSRLAEGNRQTHFLPDEALRNFLSDKWFHLCYNTTSLGKWVLDFYYQSRLSELSELSFSWKVKFALKGILGWR